jgi:predicted O-methyltransferase YrrM
MPTKVLQKLLMKFVSGYRNKILRFEAPAQLHQLFIDSAVYTESPREIVAAINSPQTASDPRKSDGVLFPSFYDSGSRLLELLDALVDTFHPDVILETGVAHGLSSRTFLEAFERGRASNPRYEPQLHSVDVDPRTKTPDLAANARWHFHLLTSKADLDSVFREVGPLDLFFHDSDHGYGNQMAEYELAWEFLKPGGFLVSDDISWSNAFRDFCRKHKLRPLILSEAPKVSGLVQKPTH